MIMLTVLVTGGSGLVGKAIERKVQGGRFLEMGIQFVFLSSKEADLRNITETRQIFEQYNPTYVIHLAARVGGLYKNLVSKVEMLSENLSINQNVLQCCHEFGVTRCVNVSSTCAFPNEIANYPLKEEDMHSGPPHPSNEGYAYAKRVSEVLMRAYNEQYGHRYVTVIPTNVYGPHDNFDIEDAHVVPGLIHKCYKAKLQGTNLTICGSGKPLRQFIFSDDLAELLLWTLLQYTGSDSLILAPDRVDEVMISDLACLIAQSMKFDEDRLVQHLIFPSHADQI